MHIKKERKFEDENGQLETTRYNYFLDMQDVNRNLKFFITGLGILFRDPSCQLQL